MKNLTKVMALLLAVVMLSACFVGCGKDENVDSTAGFSVSFWDHETDRSVEEREKTFERWQSYTDVPITWDLLSMDGDLLNLRFSSGDYPEVMMGTPFQNPKISEYAANGVFLALDDYINKKDTPNIVALFEKYPEIEAACRQSDGKIYSLPSVNECPVGLIEQYLWINKAWLDKLGLEIPKTTDELIEVLRAFKTKDPNGNGKADEIPMSFRPTDSQSYPQALLSFWGVSTKHGTYDQVLTVQDGEVKFAPVMDEWKELAKFYRDLYKEGLLDMECFTQAYDAYSGKLQAEDSRIGFFWATKCLAANKDEYVVIPPISADGITPVWRVHPGDISARNTAMITNACKNPAAAVQWLDKLYGFEETIQHLYGNIGTVFTDNGDGTYSWNNPPEGKDLSSFLYESIPVAGIPGMITAEDWGTKIQLNENMQKDVAHSEIYNPYLDDEPWPRPFYSPEEIEQLSILQTDIITEADERFAKWVTGKGDIDSEWDAYIKSLNNMGLEDFVKINQAAYDRIYK